MPKYEIPLIGTGTVDDPLRPKYRPLKQKEAVIRRRTVIVEKKTGKEVDIFDIIEKGLTKSDVKVKTKEEKIGEKEIYYNVHINVNAGIAILESDKLIDELEKAEDVKRVE